MYNRFPTLLVLVLMAVLITGCSTLTFYSNTVVVVTPIEEIDFADITPLVEFEVPEIAVIPKVVPLKALHERARVVMSDAEIRCMSDNLYREARGEGVHGMAAVGYVVLNRMGHHKFPNRTVCSTVYERNKRSGRCEFSWVCQFKTAPPRNSPAYLEARRIAVLVMQGEIENPIDDAVFFRVKTLRSAARYERHRTTLGNHNFFASI